jgi:hypothetical protein
VLVEDSAPAGQLNELGLAEFARVVTTVLRRTGQKASWMTVGISTTSNVIREFEYEAATLEAVVSEAVKWAEDSISVRAAQYDELYPWRLE